MRALAIIPARYRSTRFEGKPLAMIAGMTLLERTWRQCCLALAAEDVLVATDDERIVAHAEEVGMRWMLTSPDHPTGTDRVAEAARSQDADVYLNVQGDEPLVDPGAIRAVIDTWAAGGAEVVNAMCRASIPHMSDSAVPKVVAAPDGRLLYMSRAAIPGTKSGAPVLGHRQVCVYAFSSSALERYAAAPAKTPLEEHEDIEIVRFLELGIAVRMVEVSGSSIAVDFPADVAKVEAALRERQDGPDTPGGNVAGIGGEFRLD